jgi:hypothetical protein
VFEEAWWGNILIARERCQFFLFRACVLIGCYTEERMT